MVWELFATWDGFAFVSEVTMWTPSFWRVLDVSQVGLSCPESGVNLDFMPVVEQTLGLSLCFGHSLAQPWAAVCSFSFFGDNFLFLLA